MPKPPEKKQGQKDYIQTVVRLPRDLSNEVKATAELHGRSMNAEIIARLQASPMDVVMERLDRMERMLRAALDLT